MNDTELTELLTQGIVTCPRLHNHGPAFVLLQYTRIDPLAITTRVISPVFEPQTFTAGRELVRAGFTASHTDVTGEGDVTYRVKASNPEFLTMRWGTGYLVVVERRPVIEWLHTTYQVVLNETDECSLIDVDAAIARLLAE